MPLPSWIPSLNPTPSATSSGVARFFSGRGPVIAPRPNPILPIERIDRRWWLTPWRNQGLMDDLIDAADAGGTSTLDVLNNLITTAGNYYQAQRGGIVTLPRPGQVVPYGSPVPGSVSAGLGISSTTLMLVGGGLLAYLLLKKK